MFGFGTGNLAFVIAEAIALLARLPFVLNFVGFLRFGREYDDFLIRYGVNNLALMWGIPTPP
jgi:hypothetical protein